MSEAPVPGFFSRIPPFFSNVENVTGHCRIYGPFPRSMALHKGFNILSTDFVAFVYAHTSPALVSIIECLPVFVILSQ